MRREKEDHVEGQPEEAVLSALSVEGCGRVEREEWHGWLVLYAVEASGTDRRVRRG